MTPNALPLCGLGLLSSPSRVNQDAYSAPGGPANPRLPTPGRRTRSDSPNEEDSDRATKRRRSPAVQVYSHFDYYPSSEHPRPHQLPRSPRRQGGSSRTHLPDFIEGSSRGIRRERRRRISREPSPGPPLPAINRALEEQRESEELMSTADMLDKLARNIRAGAKLRSHDTMGWRRKCEELLRISIKEIIGVSLHCIVSGPQSWGCHNGPAPPISPSDPVILPPLRDDAPSAPSIALPSLRTVVDYSAASSPTIPAAFEASRSNSTASTNLDSSEYYYIPQPPRFTLVPAVFPERAQPPPPQHGLGLEVQDHARADGSPSLTHTNVSNRVDYNRLQQRLSNAEDLQPSGSQRRDSSSLLQRPLRPRARTSRESDSHLHRPRSPSERPCPQRSSLRPAESPVHGHEARRRDLISPEGFTGRAAPSTTTPEQLATLLPVIPGDLPTLLHPHPQPQRNMFQAVLQYLPSPSPVASDDNEDD